MKAPDKIYVVPDFVEGLSLDRKDFDDEVCYIRKDALLEWVKLAYGKVSMNPFDCSEAFEELLEKIQSL